AGRRYRSNGRCTPMGGYKEMETRQRTFTFEDQTAFADLSGDHNPLHMDLIAARRYLFGEPVVHGIHPVLWALNDCLEGHASSVSLRSLKVSFPRPIVLNKPVFSSASRHSHHIDIDLFCRGSLATVIKAEWDTPRHHHPGCFER